MMNDEKYESNFPNSNYLSNLNNLNGTNQSINLNRLPTLGEILANKSKSPVDLYTFYQFMKDVEGKVDYLDFWFDLVNHLNLCKHYVKGLRDSIVRQSATFQNYNAVTGQQQQQQPQRVSDYSSAHSQFRAGSQSPISPSGYRHSNSRPISEASQKHKSLSSSILLDLIINDNILEENDSHRLSAFLRGDITLENLDPKLRELIEQYNAETSDQDHAAGRASPGGLHYHPPKSPALQSHNRSSTSLGHSDLYTQEKRLSSGLPLFDHSHGSESHSNSGDSLYENQLDIGRADQAVNAARYVSLHGQPGTSQSHGQPQRVETREPPYGDEGNLVYPSQPKNKRASVINPSLLERLIKSSPASGGKHSSFITRENLRESSHNLLLKYFVEDSEKNLNLPQQLNSYIIKSIEVDGRDDPDIFNYVKTFVFSKLENDHLPKFLDFMATRNINHSNFGRIIAGFFFIFGGFWISFIFVFLDYRKGLRPVIIAPFFLGFYLVTSSIYLVDPILAWLGYSETFSKSNGRRSSVLKIEEKFIYKFIVKRSLWVLFLILIFTAIFTILFSLVPGHRL
ncbi:uncharacterized protein LODBEIA_P35560 [Lodderomyces beijingensis]|uniref:RGS domain-containing protein n=1 Tax=Lodderomyces beijingensis TaxID=1775926 RepID=A0ABP0ZSS8_9ASCO